MSHKLILRMSESQQLLVLDFSKIPLFSMVLDLGLIGIIVAKCNTFCSAQIGPLSHFHQVM